jgi:hypothetical protein
MARQGGGTGRTLQQATKLLGDSVKQRERSAMTIQQRRAGSEPRPRVSQRDQRAGRRPASPAPLIADAGAAPALSPRAWWLGLGGILILAVLIRLPGLDTPIGGFHSFNEAHYMLVAQNVLRGWVLQPTADRIAIYLESPPLLPYVLALAFAAGGASVLVARLVAVLVSVLLVAVIALLGRQVFNAETGLTAAALAATTPLAVIAGRNVQTDSLYLCLVTAALLFYHRAEHARSAANRLLAGLLFGLALFTKLFAGMSIVTVVVWDFLTHRARPLRDHWRGLAAVLVVLPAGLFYGYHALRDYTFFVDNVFHQAASATTVPTTAAGWLALLDEAWWAFSPPVALLVLIGVAAAIARPRPSSLYVLLPFLGYALFYLYAHKHSYYLLSLLPFGVLLAAAAIQRLPWRAARVALVGVVCAYAALISLVDYGSMKLGFGEFAEAGERLNGGEGMRLVIGPDMASNAYPVVLWYLPRAEIILNPGLDDAQARGDGPLYRLSYVEPTAVATADAPLFTRTRYGLQLFGWLIAEDHGNPHFFLPGKYYVERTGGLLDFGFPVLSTYPDLRLSTLP